MLDRLTVAIPLSLAEQGMAFVVHSGLNEPLTTLRQSRGAGLKAPVVARRVVPFGPVMHGRADWLESAGLIEPGQRAEELVVIRADKLEPTE